MEPQTQPRHIIPIPSVRGWVVLLFHLWTLLIAPQLEMRTPERQPDPAQHFGPDTETGTGFGLGGCHAPGHRTHHPHISQSFSLLRLHDPKITLTPKPPCPAQSPELCTPMLQCTNPLASHCLSQQPLVPSARTQLSSASSHLLVQPVPSPDALAPSPSS